MEKKCEASKVSKVEANGCCRRWADDDWSVLLVG